MRNREKWDKNLILKNISSVCIPTKNVLGFPFLHILSNICLLIYLWWPLWPVSKWYFTVVSTCISLMASDAEHLFICLWALCMSRTFFQRFFLISWIFHSLICKGSVLVTYVICYTSFHALIAPHWGNRIIETLLWNTNTEIRTFFA